MPYCEICHSETCEHQDRSCPCGCGTDDQHPNNNCVYDDAPSRHSKNLINGKPDEQWVVGGLADAASIKLQGIAKNANR